MKDFLNVLGALMLLVVIVGICLVLLWFAHRLERAERWIEWNNGKVSELLMDNPTGEYVKPSAEARSKYTHRPLRVTVPEARDGE